MNSPLQAPPGCTLQERRRANLRRLLRPRHVAFVGGRNLEVPLALCRRSGFAGQVWIVNPRERTLFGLPCHPSVAALPEPPDAAFVAVPREITVEVVRALAARGAGGAVCYAAGFAEVGGEGIALQRALVEAAGDLALVGPNCYGVINYVDGVAMWVSPFGGERAERGAALVAQSGNIALNLTMNDRSVPFSYMISAGNQAILGIADYVDALVEDPRVTAIGLYIEGLKDVPGFARAALKALGRGVPIVALKSGTSALGRQLTMSHTSSLAGDDRLYDALFARLGIVRVRSLPTLLEAVKLLSVTGAPPGNRVVAFTCSGGDSLMAADLAAELGLAFPPFAPAQAAELRTQLPDFATISNPLDYNTSLWGRREPLTRCFTTALAGEADFGLLVIDYLPGDPDGQVACETAFDALAEAGRVRGVKLGAVCTLPELLPPKARDGLIRRGIAPLQGLPEGLAALAGAVAWEGRRRALDKASLQLPSLPPLPEGRLLVDEWESKRMLAACGLRVPPARLVPAAEAAAAAAALGFPVVAKVGSPALAHKTEAGAVALDLRTPEAVEAAVARMADSAARHRPGFVAERFLIERQAPPPVAELIVGVRRDEAFGLALVVGAGGILVEMVADSATLLLPTERAELRRAIEGLKVARLLRGYRGRPPGDLEALLDAIMSVARFAEAERDRLVELDVNPLLVLPQGQGVLAVDALVVLAC